MKNCLGENLEEVRSQPIELDPIWEILMEIK